MSAKVTVYHKIQSIYKRYMRSKRKLLIDSSCVAVLPDGSAFSVANFPLPKCHWLYAPRGELDGERDEFEECPRPILANAQREAVILATRYAIRGATMCGQRPDFDPDALALNVAYALCGPALGIKCWSKKDQHE